MGLKARLREENRELRSMLAQYEREQALNQPTVEYLDVCWEQREVTWMGRHYRALPGTSVFRIPVARR